MKTDPQPSNSTSSPTEVTVRPEGLGPAVAGQLIAGAGALLSLLGPFSEVISGIGVASLIFGVVLSASAGRHPGPFMVEWWTFLAVGALAVLIGFGLGFWLTALGGVILTAGAVTSLAAVFFGSPVEPE